MSWATRTRPAKAGDRRVADVEFSPDGKLLAMASAEKNVIIWNVETGVHLQSLSGHANEVWSVAFSPDGRTLASGSMDGTVRLWNTATWRELVRLDPGTDFDPRSLAFAPDGNRLLAAGGESVLEWSVQPSTIASALSQEKVASWWKSGVDTRNRVRLQSEHLRLHETLAMLAKQIPGDTNAQAALAATAANWQASMNQWDAAVEQFDRLRQLSPNSPDAWLRTPGLLRLATALLHDDRPVDAASLLTGGEKRRAQDGSGNRVVRLGIQYSSDKFPLTLTKADRGSPAWQAGVRLGDLLLKFNDIEFSSKTLADFSELVGKGEGTQVKLTIQHPGQAEPVTVQLNIASYIQDDVSVELIENLLVLVDQKLIESPKDAGLHELRAELMGLSSDHEQQVTNYTAAIEARAERSEAENAVDLLRIYRRRGDACLAVQQWQQAGDDYARVVTDQTTDELLLSNQALAVAEANHQADPFIMLKPLEATSQLGTTFTFLPGDSILAGGPHRSSERYYIKLKLEADVEATAVRLEALAHPSLPGNGPGRNSEYLGNFAQISWKVTATSPDGNESIELEFDQAWADHQDPRGPVGTGGHWNIARSQGRGKNCTGIWSLTEPIFLAAGSTLTVEIQCSDWHIPENLGHFRLSLCSDPAPIDVHQRRQFWLKLTDPWQKLATAFLLKDDQQAIDKLVEHRPQSAEGIGDVFAQNGDTNWQRAIELYSLGITPETDAPELFAKRARAYEQLNNWSAAAADWSRAAKENPAGAKLLADFASRLLTAGQHDLATDQRQRARTILEQALQADPGDALAVDALAALLLDNNTHWTVLEPTEMKSEGGATLSLQPDGSILASGAHPDRDDYTVSAPLGGKNIQAMALDFLPHQSLGGNVGRGANGEFILTELEVIGRDGSNLQQRVELKEAAADFVGTHVYQIPQKVIDGKIDQEGWGTKGRSVAQRLVVKPEQPVGVETSALTFILRQHHFNKDHSKGLLVGRFRLLVSDDPAAFDRATQQFGIMQISDPWARLAAAYDVSGSAVLSVDWFRRALDAADKETKRKLVMTHLQDHPQPLAELLKQQPDDIGLQLALARSQLKEGQKLLALKQAAAAFPKLQQAQQVFSKLLADRPEPRWIVLTPTAAVSKGGAALTVQDDGSILASGANPDLDSYTLSMDAPDDTIPSISALRIEAIPDPSMMDGGVGRGGEGSVALSNVSLTLLHDDGPERVSANFDTAIADIGNANSVIDQNDSTVWAVYPEYTKPHHLTLRLSENLSLRKKARVAIGLEFFNQQYRTHGLGRFRLSVATEPMDARRFQLLDLREAELATLDVAIGIALSQHGKPAEAAAAFVRALERVDDEAGHKKLIEPMLDHLQALAVVAEQRPQDLAVQLAVAKHLAESGKSALVENRQEEAMTELGRAREIFSRLVENHPEPKWTVLRPTQMTSDGGAHMALEEDGSIFVSGNNPDRATYSISIPLSGDRITALRLETIPDARLPEGGAGRFGNGNFHVSEFSATIASGGENGQPTPIVFSSVISDIGSATNMIDGNPGTRWDPHPKMLEAHNAIFALKSPTQTDGGVLTVTLDSGITEWGKHGLGRFRLSATTNRDVIASARFHQELQAIGLLDLELALGNTYGRSGRLDEAATAFDLALNLATQRDARLKILQAASMHEGLLGKLRELRSADAAFHDALARFHQANGKPEAARTMAATARTLYEKLLLTESANSQLPKDLADLLLELKTADWTVLKPLQFTSRSGATLTPQPDGSVFVSGNLQAKETFTLDFSDIPAGVKAIQLEAIRDERLPGGGPGTHSSGNFVLSELKVLAGKEGQFQFATPIPLEVAYASFEERPANDSLSPEESGWSIAGQTGQTQSAIFKLIEPQPTSDENSWRVLLDFQHVPGNETALLGRFRLSVCTDTNVSESLKLFADAAKVTSPWARLGAAYHAIGESDRALDMFARSIELANSDQTKAAAAQQASAFEDIFARLQERFPDHQALRFGQAKYLAAQHIAEERLQSAVDVLSALLADSPNDIDLLNQRAGALMKLANWKSADLDYARVVELETDDGRRRAAERTRAECLLRMGQFQAGADVRMQEMMLSTEWDRMRDAYSAALLADKPAMARMVANRFFRTVSGNQDLDAYYSGELVRLHTAVPGLVTRENQQRLLEAATKVGGDWTMPYTAAIHYRLGNLENAQPLLDAPQKDREFHALAAMLLYDQGETTRAAGFLNRAESWLQEESAKDPHSVIPAQVAWDIWAVSRTVWHEAARRLIGPRITELDELLAKDPDRSVELLERARLLTNVGLNEDALRDLQSLVTHNVTSTESLALHGRILAGLGRDEEALPYLSQAIDSGFLDGDVYAARGILLLKQQQADAARVDLEKSIELKPNALAASSLADLLLSESDHWSVLEPAEMKSESGASLTRLADNSILVSGLSPADDVYTISAVAGMPNITSLRLEAIPDPSLPGSGPGRAPNFVLTDLQLSGSGQFAEFARSVATYEQRTKEGFFLAEKAVDQDPLSDWAIYPMTGQFHKAYFQLKQPLTAIAGDSLAIVLYFKSIYPKHVLGRFRLSVSDAPNVFDREEKRLAVLRIADPLARLAAAYLIMNDQQSLDKLIQAVPSVETTLAELYVTVKNWDRAISAYTKLIEQKPQDTILWVKVPPVAALSEHDTIYAEVCRTILDLFRKAPTSENVDRAFKACLLRPGAIDMAEIPLDLVPMSLDEATVPGWLPPWFWSTRALLAYRSSDAELAVKNVNQSEQHAPNDHCHALSLAVLAMAQHDLEHSEEAQAALNEGKQLLTKLQANNRHDHDTLIAEILLREAEAKINE